MTASTLSRIIVGIDLGTTNSAVAYLDGASDDPLAIHPFAVPQLVGPGRAEERPLLPSTLYVPATGEFAPGALDLPWARVPPSCTDAAAAWFVGVHARDRGARVPGRLVSSAKSWLCHGEVDRRAPLLPAAALEGVPRISPVDASRAILDHVRRAWNHVHPEHPLEAQEVIVTVPASFDAVARALTEEAALGAGLEHLTLIEEPQAAFYAWIDRHGKAWKKALPAGQSVLVVDIGGGTTDFSLIVVRDTPEGARPERVAVGDHLLVGGDNFDMALAHRLEERLVGSGRKLDGTRFLELAHGCREAKELLFSRATRTRTTVTVLGEGSRVVGGALSAALARDEMIQTIIEGFFPVCEPLDRPVSRAGLGLKEFGLPYVSDPRITRHMASFLADARPAVEEVLGARPGLPEGHPVAPDVVLFNGGTVKPPMLRARILGVLGSWFEPLGLGRPRGLMNEEADLAVARGAVYYGRVRRGQGIRIHGGAPRSYYLGLGGRSEGQRAGEAADLLLVAPRGMEEGQEIEVPTPPLRLKVGHLAAFPLFASTVRLHDAPGSLVERDASYTSLAPLSALLEGPREGRWVGVTLRSRLTETGSLVLGCRSRESEESWALTFSLRDQDAPGLPGSTELVPRENVDRSRQAIRNAFGGGAKEAGKPSKLLPGLMKDLERELGKKRSGWPGPTMRLLSETLDTARDGRHLSDEHEARFFHLAGFFLRPGLGFPGDEARVSSLWDLFPVGVRFKRKETCHREWSILWRRVAPGLDRVRQTALFEMLRPHLYPGEARRRSVPPEALTRGCIDQMWRLAASLERLEASIKSELGDLLLREIEQGDPREFAFWSLARLGARVPLCGAAGGVVPPDRVAGWIDRTIRQLRRHGESAGFALAQMGRLTGDRHRDLGEGPRRNLIMHLERVGSPAGFLEMVRSVVPVGHGEMAHLLGEALPVGLELHGELGGEASA